MEQKEVPPPDTEFPTSTWLNNQRTTLSRTYDHREQYLLPHHRRKSSAAAAQRLAKEVQVSKEREERLKNEERERSQREFQEQAQQRQRKRDQREQQQQQVRQQRRELQAIHRLQRQQQNRERSILEDRRRIFAKRGDRYEDYEDERSTDEILNTPVAPTGGARFGVGLEGVEVSGYPVVEVSGYPVPAMQGNGAAASGAAMAVPTPAGHQNELNLIYGMVEELSRQLADNRRATEDIVSGLGRLRNRARDRGLSNDDILGEASEEIFGMYSFPSYLALLDVSTCYALQPFSYPSSSSSHQSHSIPFHPIPFNLFVCIFACSLPCTYSSR